MTAQNRIFCRDVSLAHSEQLIATVGTKRRWLLIQDHSPWGHKAFDECAIPAADKQWLRDLFGDEKPVILLIRTNTRQPKRKKIFVVHSDPAAPAIYSYDWQSYDDLRSLSLPQAMSRELPPNYHQPLYLVCTNGKRDKCCAKYGMPLFKQLKPQLGGTLWRSSHIGGDRFAANLACLPHGLVYGRLDAESATAVVNSYKAGRIVPASFRGRSYFAKPEQAAEYCLRQQLGLWELDAIELAGTTKEAGNTLVQLRAASDNTVYTVQVTEHQAAQRLVSCKAASEEPVLEYSASISHQTT